MTARKPPRFRELSRAVARIADADRRLRLSAADRLGVGATDFDVLLLLDGAGPLAAGRIAEAMAITTGAVTGLIDRLERAGWVERTRHQTDRRQVLIELAAARRDAIDAHWKQRDRLLADADLDEDEIAATARLLDGLAERTLASLTERATEGRGSDDAGDGDRAPLGDVERGHLRFASGIARLDLRGARIKDLYRAVFEGKRPQIAAEPDGVVTVQYKGFSWLGATGVSARFALSNAVPWVIEMRRGISYLTADLRDLEVTSIDISGGASECDMTLPRPRGHATLRVSGGASRLAVRRPRGTAAQIAIRGGASNLVFDEQRMGAVGGAIRLASHGWDSAPDRWTIELTGGASDLSVTEQL